MDCRSGASLALYSRAKAGRERVASMPSRVNFAGIQAGLWSGLCSCAVRPAAVLATLMRRGSLTSPAFKTPDQAPSMSEGATLVAWGVVAVAAAGGWRLKVTSIGG